MSWVYYRQTVCPALQLIPIELLATPDSTSLLTLPWLSRPWIHFPALVHWSPITSTAGPATGAKEPEALVAPAVVPSQSTHLLAETDWAHRETAGSSSSDSPLSHLLRPLPLNWRTQSQLGQTSSPQTWIHDQAPQSLRTTILLQYVELFITWHCKQIMNIQVWNKSQPKPDITPLKTKPSLLRPPFHYHLTMQTLMPTWTQALQPWTQTQTQCLLWNLHGTQKIKQPPEEEYLLFLQETTLLYYWMIGFLKNRPELAPYIHNSPMQLTPSPTRPWSSPAPATSKYIMTIYIFSMSKVKPGPLWELHP